VPGKPIAHNCVKGGQLKERKDIGSKKNGKVLMRGNGSLGIHDGGEVRPRKEQGMKGDPLAIVCFFEQNQRITKRKGSSKTQDVREGNRHIRRHKPVK